MATLIIDKNKAVDKFAIWRKDWNKFAHDVFKVRLDKEQQDILYSVQTNPKTSVSSGTARGKDFVAAVAGLCFLYLTPVWKKGVLVHNTKVAMTAPTDRQIANIMIPEISRLFSRAGFLPGRQVGYDIRTGDKEWFLTGFKADEHNHEAWSGFHAVNTMFIVTEASGIAQTIFDAIEGNLQGNSRILIVFNPNVSVGYAAKTQTSPAWKKFRLDSLTAPNVINRNTEIPGQVDWNWVDGRVREWAEVIAPKDFMETKGDFKWDHYENDGKPSGTITYRPNDRFRVKVRGMFPEVSSDVLIPLTWIEAANERWKEHNKNKWRIEGQLRLGVDVAGMGRDSSVFCLRYQDYVKPLHVINSGGVANHMEVCGNMMNFLKQDTDLFIGRYPQAFIDTIGEGAGVYSRALELVATAVQEKRFKLNTNKEVSALENRIFSSKFSEAATHNDLTRLQDKTKQYEFPRMRDYCYWALRDWLNPALDSKAMLPPDDLLTEELIQVMWEFLSNGDIKVEAKEDIKERLGRSIDRADSLALTFWPVDDYVLAKENKNISIAKAFF